MFVDKFAGSDSAQFAGGRFIFNITYTILKALTGICAVLTVVSAIASKKLEPKKK